MTRRDERPDIDQAAQDAQESKRRADHELRQARETSGVWLSVARKLRQLREENGFGELWDDAVRGSGG